MKVYKNSIEFEIGYKIDQKSSKFDYDNDVVRWDSSYYYNTDGKHFKVSRFWSLHVTAIFEQRNDDNVSANYLL